MSAAGPQQSLQQPAASWQQPSEKARHLIGFKQLLFDLGLLVKEKNTIGDGGSTALLLLTLLTLLTWFTLLTCRMMSNHFIHVLFQFSNGKDQLRAEMPFEK